jgi:hypothetical protein
MQSTVALQQQARAMKLAHDTFDSKDRLRCLELAAQAHTLQYMATDIGVTRQALTRWRERDSDFDSSLTYALREAAADHYESNLKAQSDSGNVTATIVGLKMKKRYVEVHHSDNRHLNINVDADKVANMSSKWATLSPDDQELVRAAQDTIQRLLG